MTDERRTLRPGEADYEAIEAAVMETARGRWFLAEFARRNRHSDTQSVLGALSRLEAAMSTAATQKVVGTLSGDIADLSGAIHALRRKLAGEGTPPGGDGRDPFASIVADAHAAAAALGETARDILDNTRALAASGADPRALSDLTRRASALGLIAELETLTARRVGHAADTLAWLSARLDAMLDGLDRQSSPGAAQLSAEAPPGPPLLDLTPEPAVAPPVVTWSQPSRVAVRSLSDLEKLTPAERALLFT